jgi:diguanylate cyclase (GGDEF)-like protein/PAS domain S-box-containing protein
MSSPRAEFSTARLVSVATIVLAVGLLIVSSLVLFDDYKERRDQRSLISESSEESIQASLEELEADVARSLGAAEDAGTDLAERLDDAEGASIVALASAVLESQVGRTIPALDRVIYQDSVAQVVGVDRFGSQTTSPESAGFSLEAATSRTSSESFTNDQGQVFVSDGFAAYFPVGEDAAKGWVVLILHGDELAVDSQFDRLERLDSVESAIINDGANANLTVSAPFAGSDFIAIRQIPNPSGTPASWLPFILRVAGAVVALGGVFVLGHFVRKNHQVASRRLQNAEAAPYGSSTDFEQNIIGVVELDEMGIIVGANQAYCDQVRRERDDLIGTSLLALTEPADRTRHLAALDKLMTGAARTTQVEHRILNGVDESEIWVLEHLSRSESSDGSRILVQSQDITFRRYATWELAKQALHDELTGLANRAMLVHRLRTALNSGFDLDTGQKPLVGVMFIDVDRFKMVNDSLGHDVGDRLIKHVGERMETAVRVNDTVSRFGGDEFVVLCDNLTGVSEAVAVAERIRASLATPYVDEGATIHPTLSIGIAVCNAGEMAADDLLRDADAAMYRAKERGRNRVEVFDEGMRKLLVEQMTLESELRHAIDTEQMSMYFQPIVDSATYATAGFESLIRWPHPTRGLLTPGQFLGVAEEAGLQSQLDAVALKITCSQMARWAARYPLANELYVSSNKVPKNFPQFVQQIREIVASTGLPPGLLVVEVVESVLLDDADGALQAIEALKEMGVRVAIDDFGTGYSSLSYLTQFRPDTLKIDRAFVSLLPEDTATASVVQAITEMALALNINVVAEGVETWEQAEALVRMGVPFFQGYLFAKPRPAEEIEAWFQENEGVDGGLAPIEVEGRLANIRSAG